MPDLADGGPDVRGDAALDAAAEPVDAADDADEDGDVDAPTDERQPVRDGGPDADAADEPAPIVGVAFQELTARTADGQTVALQGLTGIAAMPDGSGLLAWEKAGRLLHYRVDGEALVLLGEARLDGVYAEDDCGLTSVAFDPEWRTNHYLFVAHCTDMRHAAVVRYEFDGTRYDDVAGTASLVIELGDAAARKPWHNIGTVGFFDDALHSMWLLVGEKFVKTNAQDLAVDLGKVLRIVPRREPELSGYEPHPDNPFAGDPEASSGPNLYAWGLRSPWRGTIDRAGRIYIGDVGETHEEINVVREPEHNFGWSLINGPCKDRDDCDAFTDPTVYWSRSSDHRYRVADDRATPVNPRVAWVGAYYEGAERDRYDGFLDDTVLFSDMCLGFVRALSLDADGEVARDEHVGHLSGLSGAGVGPDGFLYVTSFGGCTSNKHGVAGGIYRVLPRTEDEPTELPPEGSGEPLAEDPLGPMPLALSDAGLFQDGALAEPIDRAIAYEPSLPLWSNGTDKSRFTLLPEGSQVDNSDRAKWDFPPGTLFVKTFSLTDLSGRSRRLETRIIRRTEEGYDFHAYKWNSAGDADLLSLETSVPVKVEVSEGEVIEHRIPSRFDCQSCHASNDTVVIGFDELRLSGPQLTTLAAAGVFEAATPEDPDHIAAADPATVAVLGYLHGNCAHCHNGSPNAQSALSLEHGVALVNTIGVETAGSGQVAGIRIVPGSPEDSIVLQALDRDENAWELADMPPVGVQVVDRDAVKMLRAWIAALEP